MTHAWSAKRLLLHEENRPGLAPAWPACLNKFAGLKKDCIMKRSRRVILTMMGSGTIGAISMGFVRRRDCAPGLVGEVVTGLDGAPVVTCRGAAYGGFGHFPHHFHGHGHGGS
jgi:hypothetical protein